MLTTTPKKRKFDRLNGFTSHQLRYNEISQVKNVYLTTLARSVPTLFRNQYTLKEKHVDETLKNGIISPESENEIITDIDNNKEVMDDILLEVNSDNTIPSEIISSKLSDATDSFNTSEILPKGVHARKFSNQRRIAIQYLFSNVYKDCEEKYWKEQKVIEKIMYSLSIPAESKRLVVNVCNDIIKCNELKLNYNPNKNKYKSGRHSVINENDHEAKIITNGCNISLSTTAIACFVNEFRSNCIPQKSPVSWSAVEGFILRSPMIDRSKRTFKKVEKQILNVDGQKRD
jgi:hypothetical protein